MEWLSHLYFPPIWILHLNKVHLKFNNDDVTSILHKVSKSIAFQRGRLREYVFNMGKYRIQ